MRDLQILLFRLAQLGMLAWIIIFMVVGLIHLSLSIIPSVP
jgi:hypothetical protein